ncbi:hypothetical protein KQX54_012462 [Cotesia glomerata]|uniref:Endonuclease/exonuclease/phosphatase domain-containing protein n=1 Tax=Cotesia glomerata TaxID=32391 RepID=A0AAV7I114_COTGL|nr:hypothetical protein KQX54_012462 [Cotesia glomerata]
MENRTPDSHLTPNTKIQLTSLDHSPTEQDSVSKSTHHHTPSIPMSTLSLTYDKPSLNPLASDFLFEFNATPVKPATQSSNTLVQQSSSRKRTRAFKQTTQAKSQPGYSPSIKNFLRPEAAKSKKLLSISPPVSSPPNKLLRSAQFSSDTPAYNRDTSIANMPNTGESVSEILKTLEKWRTEDNLAREAMKTDLLKKIAESRKDHSSQLTSLRAGNDALKKQQTELSARVTVLEEGIGATAPSIDDPSHQTRVSNFNKLKSTLISASITSVNKYMRKNNVIVRGLSAESDTAASKLNEFFKTNFNISNAVKEAQIVNSKKLTIKATLSDTNVKKTIIAKKKLRKSEVYIDHDLTHEEGTIAAKLRAEARKFRGEDCLTLPVPFNNWFNCSSPALKENKFGRASSGLHTSTEDGQSRILDISANWLFTECTLKSLSIIIGSLYFKPDLKNMQFTLDSLQLVLNNITKDLNYDAIILGGDFNARVGTFLSDEPSLFDYSILKATRTPADTVTNHQGTLLMDFMCSNDSILLNGRSPNDTPGGFAFSNFNGKSTIELIWINSATVNLITDMQVNYLLSNSDHLPVSVSLNAHIPIQLHSTQPTNTSTTLKWTPDHANNFYECLRWSPLLGQNFSKSSVNSLHDTFCSAIIAAASSSNMVK